MLFERIQLEADEKVLMVVRKHWFSLFRHSIGIVCIALLPYLAWLFLEAQMQSAAILPFNTILLHPYLGFLYAAWLLLNWMLLAYAWTDYYLDLWTITDRRIIRVDQRGFFDREIGSFRLERLQDLNIEIDGIIATFLDFGTVEAQTASGNQEDFKERYLPKPRELKSRILEAADARMKIQETNGHQY